MLRIFLCALLLAAPAALAQGYPQKPIRTIVPFPAGGIADVFARTIGARLGGRGHGEPPRLRAVPVHARVDVTHVPYKGNLPAITDLLAGQTSMAFATVPTMLPHDG